ncbi:MAG: glycosyl transferase [Ruminococcus sp.]|nr:glycosyl transferase [Ruminococcus sp.]
MNSIEFVKKAVKHPEKIVTNLGRRGFLNWMSDEMYIKLLYHAVFKTRLNLEHPKTFSEKLQWLKLYDRNPLYTKLVDKYEVKKYVADIIGEEYIIPTLGVWDKFEDIDFDALPEQFVLKCTHDSGGIVICKDKRQLNKDEARKKINKSLKQNFYYYGREWPYKDVPPRIIAEKFMMDDESGELRDYKFYCFNGIPKYCQVISNRSTNETIDFFDMNWKLQPFTGLTEDVKNSTFPPSRPNNFEEMKLLVDKFALKNAFSRVDLYSINNNVYFGEITLYPYSGMGSFRPEEWNRKIGEMIVI